MKELKKLLEHFYPLDVYRIVRDKFLTKLFFPKGVRIVRQPAYIIGKKHIKFGEGFSSGVQLRIEVLDKSFVRHGIADEEDSPALIIGDNVTINFNVHIGVVKRISIGDNALIGSNVLIIDHDHGSYKGQNHDLPSSIPKERKLLMDEVYIGKNVWIADNVSILPGTRIGNGCIIGANSVLKGIFEDNQLIIGSPGRVIKEFDKESLKWNSRRNDN